MAMTILNNAAAQSVLGELERNNKRLGKSAQKVASGRKLNGAGDGAAEYAIDLAFITITTGISNNPAISALLPFILSYPSNSPITPSVMQASLPDAYFEYRYLT